MGMRALLLPVMLAVLTACGEARNPGGEAEASVPASPLGAYKAESASAESVTGGVVIQRGGLTFQKGVIIYTRTLDPRRGSDLMARGGDSYAAAALGPEALRIELRHVSEQIADAAGEGLCGADAPTYVALAFQEHGASVTVLVFAGAQAPGPDATDSRLCATYVYGALDGARTRQGVVLR